MTESHTTDRFERHARRAAELEIEMRAFWTKLLDDADHGVATQPWAAATAFRHASCAALRRLRDRPDLPPRRIASHGRATRQHADTQING